jgi:hypothetical protein
VADNRRSSTRHTVSIPSTIVVAGAPRACTLINLSLGGALLEAGRIAMGERVALTFSVPSQVEPIETGAVVRWADAAGVGVQFDGLRARDVWALNKYFEQLAAAEPA